MKALYIPIFVLIVLFVSSLWSSAHVQNCIDEWIVQIESISGSIDAEPWYEIESSIHTTHKNWETSQVLFHLILNHQDLDEAEKYFAGAIAACREEDSVELHIHLSQLISQLTFLADTQEVTLKNIL